MAMPLRRALGSLLVLLLGAAAVACGPAATRPVTPVSASPIATPSVAVSASDLSGSWVFGSTDEPPAGPVLGCYPFKLWNLQQTGTAVTGDVQACIGPCAAYTEGTRGTNAQGRLTLTGTEKPSPDASPAPVTYDLTFQPGSGHLTGTRNGAPFWAAPFVQKPREGCGPAPL
jgi:hypothetical protein